MPKVKRPLIGTLLLALAPIGCSATVDSRQANIELGLARDEKRAALLKAETLRLEAILEIQRRCIQISECQAQNAAIQADVHASLAICNGEAANWMACDASRTKRTAGAGAFGCLLGWAAAAVTGGAAAPAVAIGCGGGIAVGASTAEGSCVGTKRPADCGTRGNEFLAQAIARRGIPSVPQCPLEPPICRGLGTLSQ